MSDKCPKCGAEPWKHLSGWTCCSDVIDGAFTQDMPCRIRELEQQNAALTADRDRLREACLAMLATWGTQDEDAVIASRNLAEAALRRKGGK